MFSLNVVVDLGTGMISMPKRRKFKILIYDLCARAKKVQSINMSNLSEQKLQELNVNIWVTELLPHSL